MGGAELGKKRGVASPGHAPDRTAFPVATATAGRVVRDVTAAPANRGSPRRCCWGGIERGAGSRARGHVRPAGGDSAPPPRTCDPALRPRGVSRSGPAPSAKLSLPLAAARQALSYWPPPAPAIADVREAARAPPPAGRRSRDGGWRPRVTWRRCHPVSPQRHPVLPVPSPRHPPVSPPGVTALSPHCHPPCPAVTRMSHGVPPPVTRCHLMSPHHVLVSPDVTRCHPSVSRCHLMSPGVPSPGPVSPHCHSVPSQGHLMSLNVTPPCPGVTLMSPTVTPPVTLSCPGVT